MGAHGKVSVNKAWFSFVEKQRISSSLSNLHQSRAFHPARPPEPADPTVLPDWPIREGKQERVHRGCPSLDSTILAAGEGADDDENWDLAHLLCRADTSDGHLHHDHHHVSLEQDRHDLVAVAVASVVELVVAALGDAPEMDGVALGYSFCS